MAGSLNRVQLIGNLGADPEIRTLTNGSKVANMTIATSESWKDRDSGEKKERTEWHRVVIWNEGLCGVVEKYLSKGDKVMIEGQLQTRKWEKDGQDHYSTEVVLTGVGSKLLLLSTKRGGDSGGRDDRGQSSSRPASSDRPRSSAPAFENGGADDDIPF